jgi:hypothetical protein
VNDDYFREGSSAVQFFNLQDAAAIFGIKLKNLMGTVKVYHLANLERPEVK